MTSALIYRLSCSHVSKFSLRYIVIIPHVGIPTVGIWYVYCSLFFIGLKIFCPHNSAMEYGSHIQT